MVKEWLRKKAERPTLWKRFYASIESYCHYKPLGTQWPVIRVHQGDTVIITVIINDSREIHGFAIVHYDDRGFSTPPGQQHTITFVADEAGTFRMYCNVFCAIHPYMQNSAVIVTP
jgi:heme/copper-type cytochrome/quinol oxidase subunit 2